MKERKNIDRLFQEKFKDFEAHPSDRVWENIVSAKAKKEDRKVIPLWLRLGGIAAALVVLFSVGNVFWNTPENDTQLVETEIPAETKGTDEKLTPVINEIDKEGTVTQNQPAQQLAEESSNDDASTNTNVNRFSQRASNGVGQNGSSNGNASVATVQENGSQFNVVKQKQGQDQTPSTTSHQEIIETGNAVATTNIKNKQNVPQGNDRPLMIDPTQSNGNTATNKTQDAIADHNNATLKTDDKKSLVEVAEAIENEKNEEEAIADVDDRSNKNRWNVGAVAAPVYYGDFGGSGIDPQFKDNSKSGDVNLSYGVQVSYAVSDKLKVRTGVSNVDLSYGTNDISFSPDIAATRLAGVAYNSNGKFLSVTDRVSQQELVALSDFQGGGNNFSNGSISQRVGYIEVPIEAVYVVSDKRLGVEVIGGVSTLFVNDNEIAVESDGLRTPIGESSSLNEVSFTTNVGIGLNYKVTENVHINMEPTLKYQLNAFDSSAGNFKPYYVGLYTGVSYRF